MNEPEQLSESEHVELLRAKTVLEVPRLTTRLMNTIGIPIEKGLDYLPEKWSDQLVQITDKAINAALDLAIKTLNNDPPKKSTNIFHKTLTAISGGTGGAFGLGGLAVELPISTTIMLRSIADIARSHGEDLSQIDARLACVEVFAFGSKSSSDDDAVDVGYYAVRSALSKAISEASSHILKKGLSDEAAPIIIRLIAQISSRFQIAVSEKAIASAIPIIGATGGALINTIFMDHFQEIARSHFTIRGLERSHGVDFIQSAYHNIDIQKT